MFGNFLKNWKKAGKSRMELDYLLSGSSPKDPLRDRLEWLVELFRWIRSSHKVDSSNIDPSVSPVSATRIRFFLLKLSRDHESKLKLAQTLRSILYDTQSMDLFCTTGLPSESGFLSELLNRFMDKVLPKPPHEDELGEVFVRVFSSKDDLIWLSRLDHKLVDEIWELFHYGATSEDAKVWTKIKTEMEDAVHFLAGQIRALGLAPKIRQRMSKGPFRERPFYEITGVTSQLLRDMRKGVLNSSHDSVKAFKYVMAQCRNELEVAHKHLDVYGVSVSIVYQLDRIESLMIRMESLTNILLGEKNDSQTMIQFLTTLIEELREREGFGSFFDENLSLISMKISEQSAETGTHYITRSVSEYKKMFKKSAGGGAITSVTTVIKQMIELAVLPYFAAGFFASLNYSISFMTIYGMGFTLATKQPAMTANALAAKMHDLDRPEEKKKLVDEIVNLVRSQGASVIGNVSMVIPGVVIFGLLVLFVQGKPFLTHEESVAIFNKHSFLGLTPVHAAFTGILLWFSSIITGWVNNWSVYREIPQALEGHRRLRAWLGPSRLKKWVNAYSTHLAGWVGNISLGFLLGMTPKILSFFGIPLDVRHVTLSTGTVALAASSMGWELLTTPEFWWALIGIVIIGIFNVGVSFFMAMLVALKARRIQAPMRELIYSEVLNRLKESPLSFFWTSKNEVKS